MATEAESNLYKQSATYKHFLVMYNLRALADWAVNEEAYKKIQKALELMNSLSSEDFAEDANGNIIRALVPSSIPDWKK